MNLTGYRVEEGLVRISGHAAAEGAQRYIVATSPALRKPTIVPVADGPDLRNWPAGADLVIVTVPQFREALQPLVKQRQEQGLRVAVVDVAQVYDTFTAGRAEPEAIRLLVQHALAEWTPPAPRFLLLAGDASYDPRGYLQGPEADLVPSGSVHTSYSGWAASDIWYVLSGDTGGRPALAVGRLPAQTAEQMAAMVAKTLEYEGARPPRSLPAQPTTGARAACSCLTMTSQGSWRQPARSQRPCKVTSRRR